MATLARLGIPLDKVTAELVVEGVKQFSDAFDGLLAAIERKRGRTPERIVRRA